MLGGDKETFNNMGVVVDLRSGFCKSEALSWATSPHLEFLSGLEGYYDSVFGFLLFLIGLFFRSHPVALRAYSQHSTQREIIPERTWRTLCEAMSLLHWAQGKWFSVLWKNQTKRETIKNWKIRSKVESFKLN